MRVDVEVVVRRGGPSSAATAARPPPPCPGRCTAPAGWIPPATSASTDGGQGPIAELGAQQPVPLDDVAAQGLGEALRRLADLLQQEVGGVAAVDVAGRDLGLHELVGADGQRRAVVGQPGDAVELARAVAP